MPARSFGYAEVEERLQEIRRRLNLLVIQRGLFIGASAAILTATLLVVVALFSSRGAFRLSLWLVLPVFSATVALVLRFIAQRLVSLETTARFADRKAKLQDRLATLHAHGRSRSSSRLVDLLLAEALNLSPRWKVSALGLRRVSRTVYSVVASLVLLAAAIFLGPSSDERAEAPSRPKEQKMPMPQSEPQPPPAAQRMTMRTSMSGEDGSAGGRGPGGRQERGGTARIGRPGSSESDSGLKPSEGSEPGAMPANQDLDHDAAARLRNLIRNTLGRAEAGPRDASGDRALAGGKGRSRRRSPAKAGDTADGGHPEAKPETGDQRVAGARKPEPGDNAQAGNAAQGPKSAREGGTGQSGTLLGAGKPSPSEAGKPQTFSLRLTGSSAARMQLEPQGKDEPAVPAGGVAMEGEASVPEVPEQEAPDGALHRAEISPEHEAILGRIFLRD